MELHVIYDVIPFSVAVVAPWSDRLLVEQVLTGTYRYLQIIFKNIPMFVLMALNLWCYVIWAMGEVVQPIIEYIALG